MLITWRTPLAALAIAVTALATVAPAAVAGPRPRVASIINEKWSGYMDHHNSVSYTSVSATWVQPAAACTSTHSAASFWVGMDGAFHGTDEDTGTEVQCTGGTAHYFGWHVMYPNPVVKFKNPVQPGDSITASVTGTTANVFTATLTDNTQHWSQTVTQSVPLASRDSAEIVAMRLGESTASLPPLADFGTVQYTNVMVNGTMIGGSDPTRVFMVDNANQNLVSLSPVRGGTSFTVTWLQGT
jgi:hypothetical protein